jgi:hypothetical protein
MQSLVEREKLFVRTREDNAGATQSVVTALVTVA